MYAIVKLNEYEERFNILCDPSTGEPLFWRDIEDAANYGERYGFLENGAEIRDIDPDDLV